MILQETRGEAEAVAWPENPVHVSLCLCNGRPTKRLPKDHTSHTHCHGGRVLILILEGVKVTASGIIISRGSQVVAHVVHVIG